MSENIDYKVLYKLANIENLKLVKKNLELSEELDKYKMPRTYGGIIPVITPIESPNLNDFGKILAGF